MKNIRLATRENSPPAAVDGIPLEGKRLHIIIGEKPLGDHRFSDIGDSSKLDPQIYMKYTVWEQ